MKMIIAVIHPHQLPFMRRALYAREINHFTVTEVLGTAPTKEQKVYHGAEQQVQLLKRVRLEIAVSDSFVEPCLKALKYASDNSGAHGKAFVVNLEDAMTLWDGKRGSETL